MRWVWKEPGGGLALASVSKLEGDGDDDDEVFAKVKG